MKPAGGFTRIDALIFGPDITPADVTVTRDELTSHSTSARVAIPSGCGSGTTARVATATTRRIESVLFEDTAWAVVDVEARAIENQPPMLAASITDSKRNPFGAVRAKASVRKYSPTPTNKHR